MLSIFTFHSILLVQLCENFDMHKHCKQGVLKAYFEAWIFYFSWVQWWNYKMFENIHNNFCSKQQACFLGVGDKELIMFKDEFFVYFYLSDDKSFYYLASFKVTNIKYKENYGMRNSREFIERSHQIERMVSPTEILQVY